jgi:hypothetical protein
MGNSRSHVLMLHLVWMQKQVTCGEISWNHEYFLLFDYNINILSKDNKTEVT